MGTIRLLLATSIMAGHAGSIFGWRLVYGVIAVQSFYIISGFYMSLILNEKYVGSRDSYRLFISNRLLRLYPVYGVLLVMIVLFNVTSLLVLGYDGTSERLWNYLRNGAIGMGAFGYLMLTNLVIFGQDVVSFLALDVTDGTLRFTGNYLDEEHAGYIFLFIPQAWTVGLELLFYLIAPFLVRRHVGVLLVLIGVSLALRIWLYQSGLDRDPWNYRFFPTELAFFLAGSVSYRVYQMVRSAPISRALLSVALVFMVLFTVTFQMIPVVHVVKQWTYYFALVFLLPFIFVLAKDHPVDRALADLSYPVYLSHLFVIEVLLIVGMTKGGSFGLIVSILSISVSYVLVRFVERPIDEIRQRRVVASRS